MYDLVFRLDVVAGRRGVGTGYRAAAAVGVGRRHVPPTDLIDRP